MFCNIPITHQADAFLLPLLPSSQADGYFVRHFFSFSESQWCLVKRLRCDPSAHPKGDLRFSVGPRGKGKPAQKVLLWQGIGEQLIPRKMRKGFHTACTHPHPHRHTRTIERNRNSKCDFGFPTQGSKLYPSLSRLKVVIRLSTQHKLITASQVSLTNTDLAQKYDHNCTI